MTTEALPQKLEELLRDVEPLDRSARTELLVEWADQFVEVDPKVASRPFPERNRAPRCESEAYVFATDQPDGTLKFHFAVENPQGLSAKAWAAILDYAVSGATLQQVAAIDPEVVFRIFGREFCLSFDFGKRPPFVLDRDLLTCHLHRAAVGNPLAHVHKTTRDIPAFLP